MKWSTGITGNQISPVGATGTSAFIFNGWGIRRFLWGGLFFSALLVLFFFFTLFFRRRLRNVRIFFRFWIIRCCCWTFRWLSFFTGYGIFLTLFQCGGSLEEEKETLSLFEFHMYLYELNSLQTNTCSGTSSFFRHPGKGYIFKSCILTKSFCIKKQINHKYFIIVKQMFISLDYSRRSAKDKHLCRVWDGLLPASSGILEQSCFTLDLFKLSWK